MAKKKLTEKEQLEERREKVLAKGRKFKYPLQYARHKLVFNTILIALLAVIVVLVAGWLMLYKTQTTSDVLYRATQILPVSVANVDGKEVKYSDYLMIYRSSLQTVEQQSGKLGDDADANAVRNEYKRASLDSAEEYTYAMKIAEEKGITVSDEEVAEEFNKHLNMGGVERSEESFLKILNDNFGMTKSEYEKMLRMSLLKYKVMMEIDDNAKQIDAKVQKLLKEKDGDMRAIAEELGEAIQYEETGGLVDNKNIDGGRATMAQTLEPGQVSERFISTSGDGYYYVKLISKTDGQVNYASIKVPFTKFDEDMQNLRNNEGIKEYITIE
ncbi:SurA N-terminal domain-containing protein [Candidatus Saccharibacteria bacterium]|nr:SurA N-terminal domain-containing protein [Candidatus Saccharibacteria bacterium]